MCYTAYTLRVKSNRYQSFIGIVTNIGPTEESTEHSLHSDMTIRAIYDLLINFIINAVSINEVCSLLMTVSHVCSALTKSSYCILY